MATSKTPASGRKSSRSASPSTRGRTPGAASEKKKRATGDAITPKATAKQGTPRSSRASAKKKKSSEEVTGIILTKESEELFNQYLVEMLTDTTALHNVIRLQYIQCYIFGLWLLASSFSAGVTPLPLFKGTSNLIQGIAGCLGLSQAFSLTAAAQTSFSGMKKSLQYNMVFHLLFAFVVIVHQDASIAENTQMIVLTSALNVGVNMWACYFRETTNDLDEEAEELGSDHE